MDFSFLSTAKFKEFEKLNNKFSIYKYDLFDRFYNVGMYILFFSFFILFVFFYSHEILDFFKLRFNDVSIWGIIKDVLIIVFAIVFLIFAFSFPSFFLAIYSYLLIGGVLLSCISSVLEYFDKRSKSYKNYIRLKSEFDPQLNKLELNIKFWLKEKTHSKLNIQSVEDQNDFIQTYSNIKKAKKHIGYIDSYENFIQAIQKKINRFYFTENESFESKTGNLNNAIENSNSFDRESSNLDPLKPEFSKEYKFDSNHKVDEKISEKNELKPIQEQPLKGDILLQQEMIENAKNEIVKDQKDKSSIHKTVNPLKALKKLAAKPKKEKPKNILFDKITPKKVDWKKINMIRENIGLVGEQIAYQYELKKLCQLQKHEYLPNVELVSQTKGDGLGYDIISSDEEGRKIYIEVKSTTNQLQSPFIFTSNELSVMEQIGEDYYLYRIFNINLDENTGEIGIYKGESVIKNNFDFQPETIKAKLRESR